MLKFSLKRFIAVMLIVAITFTNVGFRTFAETFLASTSNIDDEEIYSGEYEEEIEDDETTTITESEIYEEEIEDDKTTTITES